MRTPVQITALALALVCMPVHAQDAMQVWVTRYNGTGNGDDYAFAVAMDSAENVVVTGSSRNASGNDDYYTAKYAAADGALIWEKRYDGPGHGDDCAIDVALDGAGNAVVTGYVRNQFGNDDYYTAKYAAADGALIWEKTYNGPANREDRAVDLGVDGAGNVAVTGSSRNAFNNDDYYTAKYAAADGALIWGVVEDPYTDTDNALSLGMDSTGNVVVTGSSRRWPYGDESHTVKYSATDGAVLWVRRLTTYSQPSCLTVDSAENIIVSGGYYIPTSSVAGIANIKYKANGGLIWDKRQGNHDYPIRASYGVAVDSSGDIAITGMENRGLGMSDDFYTAKYASATGELLWQKYYNGPVYLQDTGYAVAMDSAGNVVVTGQSCGNWLSGFGGFYDYYTIKYASSNGAVLWQMRYNGPGNGHDSIGYVDGSGNPPPFYNRNRALALTADGGAVVTGRSIGIGTGYDFATVRYRPVTTFADWKQVHLGDANAPDLGDPDGDGLATLVEYGINTLPQKSDAMPLPVSRFNYTGGERLRLFIDREPLHNDVTVEVQASGEFTGPWTTVASSILGAPFSGPGYVGGDSATPGLKTVEIRDIVTINSTKSRFLRVKVIR